MALTLTNGAVFLHVPKTGGNWVRNVLESNNLLAGELGHKHADIDRVLYHPYLTAGLKQRKAWRKRGGPPALDAPFTFCFTRHPVTWYESWFRYMSKRGWNDWPLRKGPYDWHPCAELNQAACTDFTGFVEKVVNLTPGYLTRMMSWYTKRGVGFIGKQESLVRDTVRVLNQLGCTFDEAKVNRLPPVNTSYDATAPVVWDPALRKALIDAERPYLKQYGYAEDPPG